MLRRRPGGRFDSVAGRLDDATTITRAARREVPEAGHASGGCLIASIEGLGDPQGIGIVAGTVVVAVPGRRAVMGIALGSGTAHGAPRDLVSNAPIGLAVPGARAPHVFTPLFSDSLHSDGATILIGCDGDGSVRRLTIGNGGGHPLRLTS